MNMRIATLALAGLLAAALPAHAQKECSRAEAAAAEKAIDRVTTYATLNKAWKDYRHCDTGTVADVFTDAILRLMVEWKNVEAVALDMRDPDYKKFIHSHLQTEAAKEDRESIYSRAKGSCPLTQGAFCAELMEVVKPAAKTDLLAPLPIAK
jgi:hypothetical protein